MTAGLRSTTSMTRSCRVEATMRPAAFARIQPVERILLRLQADVRIVLQHPSRQVARDGLDHVVRLAGLQEPGDDRVPQVMEP